MNHRVQKTKWCVLRWPNPSMAQLSSMSTEAFEDFFFRVCLLDYAALKPGMQALEKLMDETKEVHITGPGTDLRFSIRGHPVRILRRRKEHPGRRMLHRPGEGQRGGRPELQRAHHLPGHRLRQRPPGVFQRQDRQSHGQQHRGHQPHLDSDEGARYIGEFAIGFNREVLHPMRDILFDEKIAGSFHFTPGQAYEGKTDNGNRSQVHWDLVCIQRPEYGGGEIYFDGKLIRKDGKFLLPELEMLTEVSRFAAFRRESADFAWSNGWLNASCYSINSSMRILTAGSTPGTSTPSFSTGARRRSLRLREGCKRPRSFPPAG